MHSIVDLYIISDSDSVWDAWLTVSNLVDIAEKAQLGRMDRLSSSSSSMYDFDQIRMRMSEIGKVAEMHSIDREARCNCGLSEAEHSLLKRKILNFYQLQLRSMKLLLQ